MRTFLMSATAALFFSSAASADCLDTATKAVEEKGFTVQGQPSLEGLAYPSNSGVTAYRAWLRVDRCEAGQIVVNMHAGCSITDVWTLDDCDVPEIRESFLEERSADVEFSGDSLAAGVGYIWGDGVLHFQGKNYPFSVQGLSIVDVGYGKIDGTGDVYNLKRVEDFAGKYAAVSAGASLAAGGTLAILKNEKGVSIYTHSTTRGLKLNVSGRTITVTLKETAVD